MTLLNEAQAPPAEVRVHDAQSPAAAAALEHARGLAGDGPITTGHLLRAILDDADSQASQILGSMGVNTPDVELALVTFPVESSSDRPPTGSVEVKVGDHTTVIDDPEMATALARLDPEKVKAMLKRMLEAG